MISIVRGYKCILAVSDKSSTDKIDLLRSMGAEVHICPANVLPEDPRSYYEVAKKIHKNTPNSVYINQYFNELNIAAHYRTTGPEIWEQTGGKITHLVAASGTGGTISGTGKYLKEQNPEIKILGVDAKGSVLKKYHETGELDLNEVSPYKIEGLGKNLIPTATDLMSSMCMKKYLIKRPLWKLGILSKKKACSLAIQVELFCKLPNNTQ